MAVIDHLGWAVKSIEASRSYFETGLGLAFRGQEDFPDVRVAFFGAGAAAIELLEPLDDSSNISDFLARRGEGLHHLALRVDDVAAALAEAPRLGMRPIDHKPHAGARGTVVGFVDPQRADGVLIQYVQGP